MVIVLLLPLLLLLQVLVSTFTCALIDLSSTVRLSLQNSLISTRQCISISHCPRPPVCTTALASDTARQSDTHRFSTSRQKSPHSRQMFSLQRRQPPVLWQHCPPSRCSPVRHSRHAPDVLQSRQLVTNFPGTMGVKLRKFTLKAELTSAMHRNSPPPAPWYSSLQEYWSSFWQQLTANTGLDIRLMKCEYSPWRMWLSRAVKVRHSFTVSQELRMNSASPQFLAGSSSCSPEYMCSMDWKIYSCSGPPLARHYFPTSSKFSWSHLLHSWPLVYWMQPTRFLQHRPLQM